MNRTNIYLTEEQQRALDARARLAGTTRSAVLREIVDEALERPTVDTSGIAEGFGDLADSYERLTEGLFEADPDLRIDR